jgi:hypothetical protein
MPFAPLAILLLVAVNRAPAAEHRLRPPPADSVSVTVANRVILDIAAPASLIWSHLPGIRQRPNIERVSLNGLTDQFGSRFDSIYRDGTGKVTRHDRIEVLHWEPGVRYVALVTYLPPAPAITIVYNVDMKESGGVTRFVMDSYSTLKLDGSGTEAERIARLAKQRAEWQEAVEKGYQAMKQEIELAARKS